MQLVPRELGTFLFPESEAVPNFVFQVPNVCLEVPVNIKVKSATKIIICQKYFCVHISEILRQNRHNRDVRNFDVFLIFYIKFGFYFKIGCDGGTIPTRDELVRTKKKPEQVKRLIFHYKFVLGDITALWLIFSVLRG